MSARKAQCWTYSLHALTWVPDGGKWSASGPICLFLGKAVVSIFFFTSPGRPHTCFGLFHVGTNLLLLQSIELRFLGHLACSPAHIIPLLFMCPAMISLFLPARTLATKYLHFHCHVVRKCGNSTKNDFSKKEVILSLQLWHMLTNVSSHF
jgi:hypothetical protein